MSATVKAWFVAAGTGAVEALKDQGVCRWNYIIRALRQHLKNRVRSAPQNKQLPPQSSVAVSKRRREKEAKNSEDTIRKVMYVSWGPYD